MYNPTPYTLLSGVETQITFGPPSPPGTDLDPMSLGVRRRYRPPPTPNLVLLSQVRPCHSTTGPYPVTLLDLTFTSLSPHTSVADRSLPPAPT